MTSSKLADRRGGGGKSPPPPSSSAAAREAPASAVPASSSPSDGAGEMLGAVPAAGDRRVRPRPEATAAPVARRRAVPRAARARLPVALSGDRRRVVPRSVRGGAPPALLRGSEKRRRGGAACVARPLASRLPLGPPARAPGARARSGNGLALRHCRRCPRRSSGATTRPSAPSTRWLGLFDVTSYARVAYGRELIGRTEGAAGDGVSPSRRRAARRARSLVERRLRQAPLRPRRSHRRGGRVPRSALPRCRGIHSPSTGWHVEAARGRVREAIRLFARGRRDGPAVPVQGRPHDLLRSSTAEQREAREQERLVASIERLLRPAVKTDLETALRRRPRPAPAGGALRRAAGICGASEHRGLRRPRLGARPNGCAPRRPLAPRAPARHTGRRQGVPPRDDPSLPGLRADARRWFRRALAINPHFSLVWSPVARRYAS